MIKLLLESLIRLWGALRDDSLVEHVQVVVTGVDHLGWCGGLSSNSLFVVVGGLGNEGLGHCGVVGTGAFEVANWLGQESEVTEFHDRGLGGQLLDSIKLSLKSLDADIVGFGVLHPVDGEEITKAGSDVGAVDRGLGAAVSAP